MTFVCNLFDDDYYSDHSFCECRDVHDNDLVNSEQSDAFVVVAVPKLCTITITSWSCCLLVKHSIWWSYIIIIIIYMLAIVGILCGVC